MKTLLKLTSMFLVLVYGASHVSFAQSSNLTFGIRAGAGISFMTKYPDSYSGNIFGLSLCVGGLVNIPLNTSFSIQPELLYSSESAQVSETFQRVMDNGQLAGDATYTTNHILSTIRVPILIKMNIGKPGAGQGGIFVGPNFGYVLSVKYVGEITPPVDNEPSSTTRDYTDIANRFQVGIVIGGDYRILDNLSADIRFNYSFTKYIETSMHHASISTILVGVGYWL